MTNGFVGRLLLMRLSRVIIVAPENPVGLNANRSEDDNDGGGDRMVE